MTDFIHRLVLLRHAKSSWKSNAASDHARPLNKRGKRDAPRMGLYLHEHGWLPTDVISSDSKRTKKTVEGLFSEVDAEPSVRFVRELYHAGLVAIREQVEALAENPSVLVVGHNPGFEQAVEALSGDYHRFTTCNSAVFEVSASSWPEAFARQAWTLVDLARPKEID